MIRTIKNVCRVEADGTQTTEGFVVFKGSKVSSQDDDSIPVAIKERRKSANIDVNGVLQEELSVPTNVGSGNSSFRIYFTAAFMFEIFNLLPLPEQCMSGVFLPFHHFPDIRRRL